MVSFLGVEGFLKGEVSLGDLGFVRQVPVDRADIQFVNSDNFELGVVGKVKASQFDDSIGVWLEVEPGYWGIGKKVLLFNYDL